MEQSTVLNFFGGVSEDGLNWAVNFEKVLIELTRWLLPIGICLLAEGFCMEKWKKIEPLSCCRYETVKIWWRHKFFRNLLYGISMAAVLFLAAIAVDTLRAVNFYGEVWKVFVLWFVHVITIMSFFIILDLTKFRTLAPAILLLLEVVTFLAGFQSIRAARFMYGMWGMYFQSEWYFGEMGVSVVPSLIIQGILLVIGYLIGSLLLERTTQDIQR